MDQKSLSMLLAYIPQETDIKILTTIRDEAQLIVDAVNNKLDSLDMLGAKTSESDILDLLLYSFIHHNVIKIAYVNAKNEIVEREIEPIELEDNDAIIMSYCRLKEDFRRFNLANIRWALNTGKTFIPRQV